MLNGHTGKDSGKLGRMLRQTFKLGWLYSEIHPAKLTNHTMHTN